MLEFDTRFVVINLWATTSLEQTSNSKNLYITAHNVGKVTTKII